LNGLGFEWYLREGEPWDERFEQLKSFQKTHGHCRVNSRGKGNEKKTNNLYFWIARQKVQYKLFQEGKKCTITLGHIQKLNGVGLEWGSRKQPSDYWEKSFEKLRAFRDEQGHCRIPQAKKGTAAYKLSLWVNLQRKEYKRLEQGKQSPMSQERIQKLNGIGFVWSFGVSWDERLKELKTFQLIHGHCRVPRSRSKGANYDLANWVTYQRRQYIPVRLGKKAQIWVKRIQKLDELGFDW
jgi:hypothetical protein